MKKQNAGSKSKNANKVPAKDFLYNEVLPGEKEETLSSKRHTPVERESQSNQALKNAKVKDFSRNFSPASGMRQRHGESH